MTHRVTPWRKGEKLWLAILCVLIGIGAGALITMLAAGNYTMHHQHRAFTLTLIGLMIGSLLLGGVVAVIGLIRFGVTYEVVDE